MNRMKLSRKKLKTLSTSENGDVKTEAVDTDKENVKLNVPSDLSQATNVEESSQELQTQAIGERLTNENAATLEAEEKTCVVCDKTLPCNAYLDHWKKCLQRFQKEPSSSEDEKIFCAVCKKDLTHMNVQRRTQHATKCTDKLTDEELVGRNKVIKCSFCHKNVPEQSKVAHIKRCSQKAGVQNDQLLEVMNLLKRQAEERKACGLTNTPQPGSSSRGRGKTAGRLKQERKMDAELEMAVAMSLSLEEHNKQKLHLELKEFGIPVPDDGGKVNELTPIKKNGKINKRLKVGELPVLVTRTPAERKEIIANKICEVLEEQSECQGENLTAADLFEPSKTRPLIDAKQFLNGKTNEILRLWQKASLCEPLVKNDSYFYVSQLPNVGPQKFSIRSKRKRLSQIPGRGSSQVPSNKTNSELGSPVKAIDSKEVNNSPMFVSRRSDELEKSIDLDNLSAFEERMTLSGFFQDETRNFSGKEKSSIDVLTTNLRSMVGNEALSDVVIRTKDGADIKAHSFIFYTRCFGLYEALSFVGRQEEKAVISWLEVSEKAALIFLEYLYCARFDKEEMNDETLGDLNYLVNRYQQIELKELLPASTVNDISTDVKGLNEKENLNYCCLLNDQSSQGKESEFLGEENAGQIEDSSQSETSYRKMCFSPELLPLEDNFNETEGRLNESDDIDPSPIIHSYNKVENSMPEETLNQLSLNDPSEDFEMCSITLNEVKTISNTPETSTPVKAVVSSQKTNEKQCQLSLSSIKGYSNPRVLGTTGSSEFVGIKDRISIDESAHSIRKSDGVTEKEIVCLIDSDDSVTIENANHADNLNDHSNAEKSCRLYFSQPVGLTNDIATIDENGDVWEDWFDDGCNDVFDHEMSPVVGSLNPEKQTLSEINDFPTSVERSIPKLNQEPVIVARKPAQKRKKRKFRSGVSSSQPATPMPAYNDMVTPEIKEQLKKYGIRCLPRKKAIEMLRHVYEGTHPLVTDSEVDDSVVNDGEGDTSDKMVAVELNNSIERGSEELNSSQTSSQSSSSNEIFEESCFQIVGTESQTNDFSNNLMNYIAQRPQLHAKILKYEPLNIFDLHSDLKTNGMKISVPVLKQLLDQQCITFTMPRDQILQKRRRISPKKKRRKK